MKHLFLLCFTVLSFNSFSQGFLHRDGQNIVDGNGKNVVLRGLGLGGWMVQEGIKISETIELPISGGLSTWKTVTLKNVTLKQGMNKIRVNFGGGNFNLNFLEFKKVSK